MIGSTGRNSGKTFLAAELIRRFYKTPVTALKVTSIARRNEICPRGGAGCGACSIDSDFCLEKELSDSGDKDTALLHAAGAGQVFWLRSLRPALAEGFAAFLEHCGDEPIICESNSLREAVIPALFIMIRDSGSTIPPPPPKPSAEKVASKADITLLSPISANDIDKLLEILSKKGFQLRQPQKPDLENPVNPITQKTATANF
jgi:molybdopterin-guanine dinucleotide biosynthesis protein